MYHLDIRAKRKSSPAWSRLVNRVIYVPGAAVIMYGLWLSVTV